MFDCNKCGCALKIDKQGRAELDVGGFPNKILILRCHCGHGTSTTANFGVLPNLNFKFPLGTLKIQANSSNSQENSRVCWLPT